MRHVLIYGPPASGKLTVGRALAEQFDMALLDNHLTFDVALRVFDFGTPQFNDLVERLRVVVFEAAAAQRDSVSTFVFADPGDRDYVGRAETLAERCGVELFRVQLCPPRAVLLERVETRARLTTNKIRDVETLSGVLDQYDLYTPIDESDLRIDNSTLSPFEVAAKIAAHIGW